MERAENMNKEHLLAQLDIYNGAYRRGKPLTSDKEYDQLVDLLKENDWYPYENSVEPEPLYKGHVKHSKPMLSMQKAKTDEEIFSWLDKVKLSAKEIGIDTVWICMNAKLDGIACVKEGDIFATRGNGIEGNNVSNIIEKGIVEKTCQSDRVLGELVVKKDYFDMHLSSEFSNARNFVSGAIMADTLNDSTRKAFKEGAVVFQSYSTLDCFTSTIESIKEDFRRYEEAIWKSENYLIDGVILSVVDKELQEYMGETSHHPLWAIALKPQDKKYTSTVTKVEWNTCRTGRVVPTIIVKPIDIDGVTVSRCTGHNAKYIKDEGIEAGVTTGIIRSGSVIPYCLGVIK